VPLIIYTNGTTNEGGGGETVKISVDDDAADFLSDKLAAGTGINLTVLSPGGDEELEISATAASPDAADVDYTPTTPAHWPDPDPTNAQEALDDTGERLTSLESSKDRVKVSSNDTTTDYLLNKLAAGIGISLTETNPGGNEDVTIAVSGLSADDIDYTPAVLGDWDPDPTQVDGGLDQLAARVQSIEDGSSGGITDTFYSFAEQNPAPGTPSAGFVRVYAKTDMKMYSKDSDGTETELGGGGGGGSASSTTYTATDADWNDPDPTNVQDALDDLAARQAAYHVEAVNTSGQTMAFGSATAISYGGSVTQNKGSVYNGSDNSWLYTKVQGMWLVTISFDIAFADSTQADGYVEVRIEYYDGFTTVVIARNVRNTVFGDSFYSDTLAGMVYAQNVNDIIELKVDNGTVGSDVDITYRLNVARLTYAT
jgi:hypothetical protein